MDNNHTIPTNDTHNWIYDHQLSFQVMMGAIFLIFIVLFSISLKSAEETFFTRLSKIYLILCLSIRMIFIAGTIYFISDSGTTQSLFNNKWVLQNYNTYVDLFLLGPMMFEILPVHAIG